VDDPLRPIFRAHIMTIAANAGPGSQLTLLCKSVYDLDYTGWLLYVRRVNDKMTVIKR